MLAKFERIRLGGTHVIIIFFMYSTPAPGAGCGSEARPPLLYNREKLCRNTFSFQILLNMTYPTCFSLLSIVVVYFLSYLEDIHSVNLGSTGASSFTGIKITIFMSSATKKNNSVCSTCGGVRWRVVVSFFLLNHCFSSFLYIENLVEIYFHNVFTRICSI